MFFSITKIKAIRHYNRMINWARTQPENDGPDPDFMFDVIGENWYGRFCPYCKTKNKKCFNCPLASNRNTIHLGYFETEIEAALAYNKAALKYHKDFAFLNKIEI